MKAILTSHLGGARRENGARIPGVLMEQNGLLDRIRSLWPENARVLMICADPEDTGKNDAILSCFRESLPMSGLDWSALEMCDNRNRKAAEDISRTDVIILTGGVAYSKDITDAIAAKVDWVAPVKVYPGENELQSLAENGYIILAGETKIHTYNKDRIIED